jgi:hypothetical protein
MGSFSTTKASTTGKESGSTTQDPWGPQADYLKQIFGSASDIYGNQEGKKYGGEFVAGYTPDQMSLFKNQVNYANTSPIAGLLQNQGSTLGAAGTGGVQGALQGYQDFRPGGSTMGTIADAGLYADNPYISSMVDAATRDAARGLYEGDLPRTAREGAISGNTNSSKQGIREGILERGYQDLRGDVSANLRGAAYDQGLNLAQQQRQHEDQTGLERLSGFGSLGLGSADSGMGALNNSVEAMINQFNLGNEAAAGQRDASQATIDNALAKYQFNKDDPWGSLMNYYNIIGENNWGGTGTTKGRTSGSASQTASGASTLGGVLGAISQFLPGSYTGK